MQKFSDIQYVRPDMDAIRARVSEQVGQLEQATDYAQARAAYLAYEQTGRELETMASLASIRNTLDTTEEFYEGEVNYINGEYAKMTGLTKRAARALLISPFRADFEAEFGAQFLRVMAASERIQCEENIELTIQQDLECVEFNKTAAGCSCEFDGEICNFYGLQRHMQSTDRDERRRAFLKWAELYEKASPQLDAQFDKLTALRKEMARRAGFASFTEMAYLSHNRLDYGPDDVRAFREQVKQVIVPVCARLFEEQAQRLGVDKLRYYDESLVYPEGNAVPQGDMRTLVGKALKMYRELSPETGEYFDFMAEHELFDLETRPGKHMGGYCTSLPGYDAPFIFSNFNGTSADVDVLTHEAGHAFECYTAMRCQPLMSYHYSTSEVNEIHSMAMEFFTYPWMELFFGENADKYRRSHLMLALEVIPYMCCVDEFQHHIYAEELDAAGRRRVWRELERQYMPWRDYDGNAFLEGGGFWMQKQHIFLYPFYYIDYALAQTCVFELYGRMKQDRAAAWQDYLRLCRAGGSKGYMELLKVANLHSPFLPGSVEAAVKCVTESLESGKF